MATRPVFIPRLSGSPGIDSAVIDFQWFPGLSKNQKQRSIQSLHAAAAQHGLAPILEISTKSETCLGVELSAFNLRLTMEDGRSRPLENIFQSAKVFEHGGPYVDLLDVEPWQAKNDSKMRSSGQLTGFRYGGHKWPIYPKTAFYNWLYLSALHGRPDLSSQLLAFRGFSDIEFNPARSINCQAAAAAFFVSLCQNNEVEKALHSPEAFIACHGSSVMD